MDATQFVKDNIQDILAIDEGVVPTAKLADLGMDEMDIVDLVVAAEDELGIEVGAADEGRLLEGGTVQDAVDIFTKLLQQS